MHDQSNADEGTVAAAEQSGKLIEASTCSRLGSLPVELTQKILQRLPLSSIVHCKLVSKCFYRIINDEHFALEHFPAAAKNNPFLFLSYDNSIYFMDLEAVQISEATVLDEFKKISLPFQYSDIFVVGSCSGYLCISTPIKAGRRVATIVWNPVTGHFVKLPLSSKGLSWAYGFGFHPLTGEHKVVKICYMKDVHGNAVEQHMEIFTLGSDHGRILRVPLNIHKPGRMITENRAACLDGSMHWLVDKGESQDVPTILILTLDLNTEELKEISLPDGVALSSKRFEGLMEIRGCLALVVFNDLDQLNIWVMKDYGMKGSWVLQFVIEDYGKRAFKQLSRKKWGEFVVPCVISLSGSEVICLIKDDKLLITFPLGGVFCYDFKEECFMHFDIQGLPDLRGWPFEYEALSFTGSLIRIT